MLFRPEKWSSNKVKEYRHFEEGLVHGFCQKIDNFLICFFFSKKSQKETFFDILETKECFLDHKRKVLRNCKKNRHFAKGSVHGFCQKIDLFLICFFFSKKRRKETFFDILDRKECFYDLKSEVLKKSKKSKFSKGVSPWLFSKNRPFSYMFFFSKKSQKEKFFWYSR